MRFQVGIEDLEPDLWIAWVLDLPGCYGSGHSEYEALSVVPQRIEEHYEWLRLSGMEVGPPPDGIATDVVEVFYGHPAEEDSDYRVNAFFRHDNKPLIEADVLLALELLTLTRSELDKVLSHITTEERLFPRPDEKGGSIDGILQHVAGAEWWYLDRLEYAPPLDEMPEDTIARLEWVRAHTRESLQDMVGRRKIFTWVGEKWSARKLVRRALWHERHHTEHIAHIIEL